MARAPNTQVHVLSVTFSYLMLMMLLKITISAQYTKVAMFKFAMQQLLLSTSIYSADK